jgi:serine/threonine protein kinase/class 3 adenylate cyclase
MNPTSPAQTSAQRKELVVMFTDIVDFTAYCDAHGEEASLALVNRHEDLVCPIVQGHGGTFVKTIGDAIMAWFEQPEAAALAGQEIMRRVGETNEGKSSEEQMHLRAAFNRGPVMMKNNDLFGDTVNLASRIMGVGHPDQIMLSHSMLDSIGENPKFICRFVGNADFKGKTGVVELYELLVRALELTEKKKSSIVSDELPSIAPEKPQPKEKLIAGKYFIERLIGEGAYGKVFKARQSSDGKAVAIKILPEEAYVFYSREAQVLRQLQPFPYVMEILDAVVDPQGLCIVMPYFEHGSLQTYMNKCHGAALEPGQILSLMEELLAAIGHAHLKEVIHRDVKPQNILLRNGTDGVLTDFGVAYAVESTGRTSTLTAGTSGYIAPEVTSGRFDNTIDLYSAGVVLYRMLGGEFPMNVDMLPPSTFPEFKKIVERAIAPRQKRYASAEEMLVDLEKLRGKVIGPTIQSVAQTGEERVLMAVTESTWTPLEAPFGAAKLMTVRCDAKDLIKKVHWHVPAVTVLDFTAFSSTMTDIPAQIRACQALGTRVIVINCPSEAEARVYLKNGAADCLPSITIHGAVETLKSSIETLITQVQLGTGSSWWKKILG